MEVLISNRLSAGYLRDSGRRQPGSDKEGQEWVMREEGWEALI